MQQQKDSRIQILEKTVLSQSRDQAVGSDSLVKLRTWIDGNENRVITGTYLIGTNELDGSIQNIVLQMVVGDIWKIKTFNKITDKEQIMNIQILETRKLSEGDQIRKIANANIRADENKKQGNSFIKDKNYQKAIQSYEKAYKLIQYNCDQQAVQIRLSLLSNLALATLNAGKYRQCVQWCNKHINESIQINKKVLYRQVSAFKGLREWTEAKQKISQAFELLKDDAQAIADFKSLKQAIEKEQKVEMARQKKVYTNMFG